MMQRDTQVKIAAALGAGLLGLIAAPAVAQPVEPARTVVAPGAAPDTAQPTAPEGQAAAAAPVAAPAGQASPAPAGSGTATDKPATDKPAAGKPATDKPAADKAATDKPAADKPAAGKPAAGGKTALPDGASIKVERTSSGAKLFRITEGLLVEGQMQRPNAFLVLQRATVDYDYEALSESFLPRIIAAAREKPF